MDKGSNWASRTISNLKIGEPYILLLLYNSRTIYLTGYSGCTLSALATGSSVSVLMGNDLDNGTASLHWLTPTSSTVTLKSGDGAYGRMSDLLFGLT